MSKTPPLTTGKPANFKVGSGLKTILGKELITDDFIAVFELVKNSFDANATEVTIELTTDSLNNQSIRIRDNGEGMSADDLLNKWLVVAYSSKKEEVKNNYRDSISKKRVAAGAKGIGRFSCDKLGGTLRLHTKPKGNKPKINELQIDWSDFEASPHDNFIEIPVEYKEIVQSDLLVSSGTALEISELRDDQWDRDKLLKLKQSLEKLISPTSSNNTHDFSIILKADSELESDSNFPEDETWNRINGPIVNRLTDKLNTKTTRIEIDLFEGRIVSTLFHKDRVVYEVEEHADFPIKDKQLEGISIVLYYLNASAKNTFTRHMGLQPVKYGSVFIYRNGFRIHPFGDEGADPLGIDRRKQQRGSKAIGTRELYGRVNINDRNGNFVEISSRDGGFVKNVAYEHLTHILRSYALYRLEKFAIDITRFEKGEAFEKAKELSPKEFKEKALDIVTGVTKSADLISYTLGPDFVDVMKSQSASSLGKLLSNFRSLAENQPSKKLEADIKQIEKRYELLVEQADRLKQAEKEREQAEHEANLSAIKEKEAEERAAEAEASARELEKRKDFFQALLSPDSEDLIQFHHHIGISAGEIQQEIEILFEDIRMGIKPSIEDIKSSLVRISEHAKLISSVSGFATKANFNLTNESIDDDICIYIENYLNEIIAKRIRTKARKKLKIHCSRNQVTLLKRFKPMLVSVMIDNLCSNSKKADATSIKVSFKSLEDKTVITFQDNGSGFDSKLGNDIFNLGVSTTTGSGIGLYHVSDILKSLDGEIEIDPEFKSGARLIITLNHEA